jgi:hypothetical protein
LNGAFIVTKTSGIIKEERNPPSSAEEETETERG